MKVELNLIINLINAFELSGEFCSYWLLDNINIKYIIFMSGITDVLSDTQILGLRCTAIVIYGAAFSF